jgi:hypothetical protein
MDAAFFIVRYGVMVQLAVVEYLLYWVCGFSGDKGKEADYLRPVGSPRVQKHAAKSSDSSFSILPSCICQCSRSLEVPFEMILTITCRTGSYILSMRVYAIWGKNRIVLGGLM